MMSIATSYQLSIFGKNTITPSPDTITALMSKINQDSQEIFLPSIISSQQIEIPSNKITTLSNLGFITQDQQYSITILNERIDINYHKVNESLLDINLFYDFAIKVLSAIIEYSGIMSNRLAMNIQQVCEMSDFSVMKERGKFLVKGAAYYDDKDFEDWSMHTNAQHDIDINGRKEGINVITNISSGQDVSCEKAAILFHIDINTLPQNQNMRFNQDALLSFVQNVKPIAIRLIEDVERLITDEQ